MKLTIMGGEFPAWSSDSKKVHWSLGASHFRYDLMAGRQYKDSLEAVKKKEKDLKKSEKEQDSTKAVQDDKKDDDDKKDAFKAAEFKIKVPYKTQYPQRQPLAAGRTNHHYERKRSSKMVISW